VSSLSAFRFLVAPEVPGAPNLIIDNAVLLSCRDFCKQTHLWRYEHPAIPVVSGTADYELDDLPSQSEVIWVNTIGQSTHDVASQPIDIVKKVNPGYQSNTGSAAANFTMIDSLTVRLMPIPTAASAITPDVILRPTLAASSVWDTLFNEWGEVIAAGAKARLQMQPGKNYSNPEFAIVNTGIYKSGITDVRRRMNNGFTMFNDTIQAGSSFT